MPYESEQNICCFEPNRTFTALAYIRTTWSTLDAVGYGLRNGCEQRIVDFQCGNGFFKMMMKFKK